MTSVNEELLHPKLLCLRLPNFGSLFRHRRAIQVSNHETRSHWLGSHSGDDRGTLLWLCEWGIMVPAALAANWLAAAWNQNAALRVMSPIAAELEEIVLRWICEALVLPPECTGGLVTCATMANFTALVTARHALLGRAAGMWPRTGCSVRRPLKLSSERKCMHRFEGLESAGFGEDASLSWKRMARDACALISCRA